VLPPDLKIFTVQIEAHGKGSPAEAVDLARALRVHLWGAKNAAPGWIEAAQAMADREKDPVRFFVANEEYGTFVSMPGQGVYSHTSDVIAPAGAAIGPSLAGPDHVTWEEFRERRLATLQEADGRLVWQFGENEAQTRLYLDDSLERGGYAAISTFHFGNPDFTNSEPFLKQYRNRIAYIGLQDAHGDESWWWGDQLEGFRVSGGETWMHGPPEVVEFVRGREAEWRWWDNPAVRRPAVSVVALTPWTRFEAGAPREGVTVRVRCLWENTAQGRPKAARTELVRMLVDGREVRTTLVADGPRGRPNDHYHTYHDAAPAAGEHTVTAVVRWVESGEEAERTIRFVV
jgi:hypothetical protein